MAESDFNIWYKSKTESFLYINERSNIKNEWLDYSYVKNGKYANSIIKPINKYVENLYPKPLLSNIEKNKITLEYCNFAEIMLLKRNTDKELSAMEKVHMRQFYLSDIVDNSDNNCFNNVYRVFIPWFIDIPGLKIKLLNIENSPFQIIESEIICDDYSKQTRIDPKMIFFKFKNIGNHMIDEEYGKISRETSMFKCEFDGNDIMIKKIKEFYAKS